MELILLGIAGILCLGVFALSFTAEWLSVAFGGGILGIWSVLFGVFFYKKYIYSPDVYKEILKIAGPYTSGVKRVIANDKAIESKEKFFSDASVSLKDTYGNLRADHAKLLSQIYTYLQSGGSRDSFIYSKCDGSDEMMQTLEDLIEIMSMANCGEDYDDIATTARFVMEAKDNLAEIEQLSGELVDKTVTERIKRVILVGNKINNFVWRHTEYIEDTRRVYRYYIPVLHKILDGWKEMDADSATIAASDGVKDQVIQLLEQTETGFTNIYNRMYHGVALDIESDISVAKQILKSDGQKDDGQLKF